MTEAVDRLSDELKVAYPAERRKKSSAREVMAYVAGEQFLRSLAMSTFRLIETDSALAFDKSYRFQGESVAELLRHLMSKGLELAPCEKGGEPVYRRLYTSVRGYYMQLVPKANE